MEIKKFNGDYSRLSEIIHKAWIHEHGSFIDFTPDYLKFIIESPDTDSDLTLGVYRKNVLISFILSKRKKIEINNRNYKALLNSLSTTDPEEAKFFPYLRLKEYCIDKAIKKNYLLNYGFINYKIKNYFIEQFFAEKRGFCSYIVKSFGNYIYVLQPEKMIFNRNCKGHLKIIQPKDVTLCKDIIDQQTFGFRIRENWNLQVLQYLLIDNQFSFTFLFKKEKKVYGFINYQKVKYFNNWEKKDVISIQQLFFKDCTHQDQVEFLEEFIAYFKNTNAYVISIPDTGAWNTSVLKDLGFIKIDLKNMRKNLFIIIFNNKKIEINNSTFNLEII